MSSGGVSTDMSCIIAAPSSMSQPAERALSAR
jgi:hypothetical protein